MLKVMLIDDEYYERMAFKRSVPWASLDMEVVGEANNGEDALQMILQNPPDIVVVDINMPKLNGLELISRLNASRVNCRYIILTGYDDFKYAQRAIRLNVFDYILKPVDYKALIETLQQLKENISDPRYPYRSLDPSSDQPAEPADTEPLSNSILSNITLRTEEYIQEHISDSELSIAEISKALFLDYSYLCYCFKRDKGCTINDYINQYRIQKAIQMMRSGVGTIDTISERCGFGSSSYFSKKFKKITGLSPREYMKNNP